MSHEALSLALQFLVIILVHLLFHPLYSLPPISGSWKWPPRLSLLFITAVLASSGDPVITYKNFDEQNAKTWKAAKEACSNSNSTLALLDTQKKIDAVKDSLSRGEYWIGLRYHGGRFVWSTGAIADESFVNNLYSGNRNSLQNSGKTCFLLKTTGRPPFKKERCDKRHGFICQITGEGPSVAGEDWPVEFRKVCLFVCFAVGLFTPNVALFTLSALHSSNIFLLAQLSYDYAKMKIRLLERENGPVFYRFNIWTMFLFRTKERQKVILEHFVGWIAYHIIITTFLYEDCSVPDS